jgi:phosphotransferase system HPr (HPr) family protein
MDNERAIRRVRLVNSHGLHLRPAKLLSESAQRFSCDIRILCGSREADAKSILDLFKLAARHGSLLILEARGRGCNDALDLLAQMVQDEFKSVDVEEGCHDVQST